MTTIPLKLQSRLFYYTLVGGSSALAHLALVFIQVAYFYFPALIANVFAFFIAFNLSYFGHKHLTFSQLQDQKVLRLPYFFLVALSAGALNEGLYFLILRFTQLNYLLALILVLILVSIYSFMLSRYWACR